MNECKFRKWQVWKKQMTIHHGQVSRVSANLPSAASKDTLVQECISKGRQRYYIFPNTYLVAS